MNNQNRCWKATLKNVIQIMKSLIKSNVWVLFLLITTACMPLMTKTAPATTIELSQAVETEAPASDPDPTLTHPFSTDSPLLLIQSNFNEYRILDLTGGPGKRLEIPNLSQELNLPANLSPSGTQLLLQVGEEKFSVISLPAGNVQSTYHLVSPSPQFNLALAAQEALDALPGQKFSQEAMFSAVQTALDRSKTNIQWFGSDRFWLIVLEGGQTSTNLFLKDLQTGSEDPFEQMPGLVEGYWTAPGGRTILLKKSYVFEPNIWQDDRYYLLDSINKTAKTIPIPENADNPSVFWISENLIGITHQTDLVGGTRFSILDIDTMESNLVVNGAFSGLYHQGEQTLILKQDNVSDTTTLSWHSLDGEVLRTQELEGQCFIRAAVNNDLLLLNCETKSILINTDIFSSTPFGEPISLFAPSPDAARIVLLTREGNTTLWDAGLKNPEEILLEGSPQEFLWLPDSSGFLYRTAGKLIYYDLNTKSSRLLINSEFLGDYRNLNAAWIKQK